MSYTQEDIVEQLETNYQTTYQFLIDFEHPYFHTAGSRLTLYADRSRWAIVFEKSGYSNSGYRGEIELFYFGNCLQNLEDKASGGDRTSNMQIVALIDNDEIERMENDYDGIIAKGITQVKVRETLLDIELNIKEYEKRDIRDEVYGYEEGVIHFYSLIRYLDELHPELFRATEEELRMCLPDDLPKIMHINQWHHQTCGILEGEFMGDRPGDYETYPMIADVLVSKDPTKWKPTLAPNNDWRNWPGAGYM
jgi:hypothetical protein